MPKIRNIPFGYKMKNGQIKIDPCQEETIRSIYQMYLAREPVTRITVSLNGKEVMYREGTPWNKNMVCRILSDSRYLGEKGFPRIISTEIYDAVHDRRNESNSGKLNPEIRLVRQKIVCAYCENQLLRISHGKGTPIEWKCKKCNMQSTGVYDTELLEQLHYKVERMTEESCSVIDNRPSTKIKSLELIRLTRKFEREVANQNMDTDYLLEMAKKIAQEQYNLCMGAEIQADDQWLKELLLRWKGGQMSEEEFIQQAISKIKLSADGQISLKLINNKIL